MFEKINEFIHGEGIRHEKELVALFYHLMRKDYASAIELLIFKTTFVGSYKAKEVVDMALMAGLDVETFDLLNERFNLYVRILETMPTLVHNAEKIKNIKELLKAITELEV